MTITLPFDEAILWTAGKVGLSIFAVLNYAAIGAVVAGLLRRLNHQTPGGDLLIYGTAWPLTLAVLASYHLLARPLVFLLRVSVGYPLGAIFHAVAGEEANSKPVTAIEELETF